MFFSCFVSLFLFGMVSLGAMTERLGVRGLTDDESVRLESDAVMINETSSLMSFDDDEERSARLLSMMSPDALAAMLRENPNLVSYMALLVAAATAEGFPQHDAGWQPRRFPNGLGGFPRGQLSHHQEVSSRLGSIRWTVISAIWAITEMVIKFMLVFIAGPLPATTDIIHNPLIGMTELPALPIFALDRLADSFVRIIFPYPSFKILIVHLVWLGLLVPGVYWLAKALYLVDNFNPKEVSFWEAFFGDLPFLLLQYLNVALILSLYQVIHVYFEHKWLERQRRHQIG